MESIRTYDGEIRLCGSCGQPCFDGEVGWEHFQEQWDGIHCPHHPLAADDPAVINWDRNSLEAVKRSYPDTSAHAFPSHATT